MVETHIHQYTNHTTNNTTVRHHNKPQFISSTHSEQNSVRRARKVFSWKLLENNHSRLISTQSVFILHTNCLYLIFEWVFTFLAKLAWLVQRKFAIFFLQNLRCNFFQVSNIFLDFQKSKDMEPSEIKFLRAPCL